MRCAVTGCFAGSMCTTAYDSPSSHSLSNIHAACFGKSNPFARHAFPYWCYSATIRTVLTATRLSSMPSNGFRRHHQYHAYPAICVQVSNPPICRVYATALWGCVPCGSKGPPPS
eukprot:XP_001693324.1 predicted protein [Chlamydomonas reinhardtii]